MTEEFVVDPEEPYFRGHFPGFPLLPGVVQLRRASALAQRLLGAARPLREVRKMKFTDLIRPGDRVVLTVEPCGDGVFSYRFTRGDRVCSSGFLQY